MHSACSYCIVSVIKTQRLICSKQKGLSPFVVRVLHGILTWLELEQVLVYQPHNLITHLCPDQEPQCV